MTEHEIIEKSFIIADKIYFTFIDELSKHEQEKFIIHIIPSARSLVAFFHPYLDCF